MIDFLKSSQVFVLGESEIPEEEIAYKYFEKRRQKIV